LQRKFVRENSVSIVPIVLLPPRMAMIQITPTKFVDLVTGDGLCGMERGVDRLTVAVTRSMLLGRKTRFVSVLDGTPRFVCLLLYSISTTLIPVNEGRRGMPLMRVQGTIGDVQCWLVIVNRIPQALKIVLRGK
jgi:hypothetical protein